MDCSRDTGCRTLVVDDERGIRKMATGMLNNAGYECKTAACSEEALSYMNSQGFDVVITDIVMPGIDGIELTTLLRKEFDVGILVMTGYARNYSFDTIIGAGANDFIEKPFRRNELIIRTKRIIDERAVRKDRNRARKALVDSEHRLRALSIRLKETEENLRKDLSRELHDRVGQKLTALNINLNLLYDFLPPETEKGSAVLEDSIGLVEETTDHIRDVMSRLRPVGLDDYGIVSAIDVYGKTFSARTGTAFALHDELGGMRLAPSIETELFRIAQEAMTNIAKHAGAGRVDVFFYRLENEIKLVISDNGIGFELPLSDSAEAVFKKTGWGLISMKERAHSIDATFDIFSKPGKGTSVEITVPRSATNRICSGDAGLPNPE
ncbi:MAG: response regulator [Desulfobacterales bacterium]